MGGYHGVFTALEVGPGVLSTSALTQTYCGCKSRRSHTPPCTSSPWIFKQVYIPRRLTLSTILPLCLELFLKYHSNVWHIGTLCGRCLGDDMSDEIPPSHVPFFPHRGYSGHLEVTGCVRANASGLVDRWHTSRPMCSFTSTIKIHSSIFAAACLPEVLYFLQC